LDELFELVLDDWLLALAAGAISSAAPAIAIESKGMDLRILLLLICAEQRISGHYPHFAKWSLNSIVICGSRAAVTFEGTKSVRRDFLSH
jgi:hypothetical protein